MNQPPPPPPTNFPGAWPPDDDKNDDDHNHDTDNDETHGRHQNSYQDADFERDLKYLKENLYVVSQAMYRELDAKQAILDKKNDELFAFLREDAPAASSEKKSESVQAAEEAAWLKQMAELDELEQEVKTLSAAADEQYAKEITKLDEFRDAVYAAGF